MKSTRLTEKAARAGAGKINTAEAVSSELSSLPPPPFGPPTPTVSCFILKYTPQYVEQELSLLVICELSAYKSDSLCRSARPKTLLDYGGKTDVFTLNSAPPL